MFKIELNNIKKSYDNQNFAVNDVSFGVNEGEFLVLLGPSGCGKSTLLRMIAGLEEITDGELFLNGNLANKLQPHKRSIGMVFQNYALYPHLSVKENLKFPLKIKKIKKEIIESEVLRVAEIVGLIELLDRKPAELSGGQRQRVALGRALIKKPDIFLFDEPLSNLDAKLRTSIRREIIEIHKLSGTTSIYVTHDQNEAMTMADRIILLNKGQIVQIGTPEEIYEAPADIFAASFIGNPEMNVIELDKLNYSDHLFAKEVLNNAPKDAEFVGIRAENFIVEESEEGEKPQRIEFLGIHSVMLFKDLNIKAISDRIIVGNKKYTLKLINGKEVYFNLNKRII